MWPANRKRTAALVRRHSGFSLIEVLIAVLVLGVGLLGVAALQTNALKNNQLSLQRTQATAMIYFMFDAMRANRGDAGSGEYHLAKTCSVPSAGSTLVSKDHSFWLQALKGNIGDESTTCGEINCPAGATSCTVAVYWVDKRFEGDVNEKFEVSTRL